MTVADLTVFLRAHQVPDSFYVTDGRLGAGECVGIEQAGSLWSVYYSERGRKMPMGEFPYEDTACHRMIALVNRMLEQGGRPPLP